MFQDDSEPILPPPHFFCCMTNVKAAKIWTGIRLFTHFLFLLACSVYVSSADSVSITVSAEIFQYNISL